MARNKLSLVAFAKEIEALPADFVAYERGKISGSVWFKHADVPYCTGKVGVCAIEAVAHARRLKDPGDETVDIPIHSNYEECGAMIGLTDDQISAIVNAADEGLYVQTARRNTGDLMYDAGTRRASRLLIAALERRSARLARAASQRRACPRRRNTSG